MLAPFRIALLSSAPPEAAPAEAAAPEAAAAEAAAPEAAASATTWVERMLVEVSRFDPTQLTLPTDHPALFYIALGVLLLLAGRRLFWVTLGAAGFFVGLLLMSYIDLPASAPIWADWAVAAVFGLIGVLLAFFVQKVMVGTVGFVAGGLAALWAATTFAWPVETWAGGWGWLIVFVVGGGVMALLAGYLFEAALVVLSALGGAASIVAATSFSPQVDRLLFPALALVGMMVQAGLTGGGKSAPSRSRRRRRRREEELPEADEP